MDGIRTADLCFWDLATVTQSSVRHYETIIFATFMTIEFDPDKNGK